VRAGDRVHDGEAQAGTSVVNPRRASRSLVRLTEITSQGPPEVGNAPKPAQTPEASPGLEASRVRSASPGEVSLKVGSVGKAERCHSLRMRIGQRGEHSANLTKLGWRPAGQQPGQRLPVGRDPLRLAQGLAN
jgi:hypothetical protein